ncbi:MAG: acyl-ACP--UDP-N-acetylglucosamine O-acyltransferase [Pseudomonadota bacterium]
MSDSRSLIHPTAIIAAGAVIGEGTSVGPYSIIGPNVRLGRDNVVGPHVVLDGHTTIGDGNTIYQFASVGAAPQDLKYRGEPSELRIGSKNIIREYVTLQPGTAGGGMLTSIGDQNLFMANTHVGHDSHVGSRCVVANGAALAGHVRVADGVIIGGLSGIHQFVRLGSVCMIGAGAMVAQDIPPYCMAQGDRATVQGLNRVGLERNGGSKDDLAVLREAYRAVFAPAGTEAQSKVFKDRVAYARSIVGDNARGLDFVSFMETSERGVAPHHRAGE